MILTDENYYSVEADIEYMSCSQMQGFLECEAKQIAKLQGRWKDEPTEAFLVGNFFHSYFESPEAHERFCMEHLDDIYTASSIKKYLSACEQYEMDVAVNGESRVQTEGILVPFKAYQIALKMIDTVMNDKMMRRFVDIPGENEKIIEGEIFGMKWRGKLDKYIPDMNFIIDYKTVANIWETSYNPILKRRETFVEKYGYLFRAAVYSILEMQMRFGISFSDAFRKLKNDDADVANFILLCVSKQDYPDKECIRLNHVQEYIRALDFVKERLPRIKMLKEGRAIPKRCGMCDYCRSTKQLSEIKPYYELIPEFRTPREFDDEELEKYYVAGAKAVLDEAQVP